MPLTPITVDETVKTFINKYIEFRPGCATHTSTIRDAYTEYARTTQGKIKLYRAIENISQDVYKRNDSFINIKIKIVHWSTDEQEEQFAHERELHRIKCESDFKIRQMELEYEMKKLGLELEMKQTDLALAKVNLETSKYGGVVVQQPPAIAPKIIECTPEPQKQKQMQDLPKIIVNASEELDQLPVVEDRPRRPAYDDSGSDYESDDEINFMSVPVKKSSKYANVHVDENERFADIKREILLADEDEEEYSDDEDQKISNEWRDKFTVRELTEDDFNYKEVYNRMMQRIQYTPKKFTIPNK